MNIVIILTLVYMLALFVAIVLWLTCCSRKERPEHLKKFKHGKFAFIYLAVIPLFFLAQRYNGQSIDGALWLAVRACIEVVVLRFDYATVAPLLTENLLYHIAIELLFSLIVLNTLMFTLSFCGQWLYNRIIFFFTHRFRKKVVAVVGTNKNALDILGSVPKGHRAILFGKLTPELKGEAYLRHAAYVELNDESDLGALLGKYFKSFGKRKVSVIMALEDDEKSLLYVKQLCALIANTDLTKIPLTDDFGLSVYVFASKANEEIFAHYVEETNGIIHFINRHKQIAMDFIDRYPLTQFMTEREIDYNTATIRDEIDLNVLMIGFGKLNESLFLASVSNNQFLTVKEGRLQPKPVTYHLYDRYYPQGKFTAENALYSETLNHGYLRYEEFRKHYSGRENEFLEWIPMPAVMKSSPCEIAHPDFYPSIRDTLRKENAYSYIIVSFGTDMENIELAEKLQQKLKEWRIASPVKLFVKVRDIKAVESLGKDLENVLFFGSSRGCVYNAEVILHERIERMARLKHLIYAAEDKVKRERRSDPAALSNDKIHEEARRTWYAYKEFQRESNTFACLSARMKLQLCGYDYAEEGEDASGEFLRKYEAGDARVPTELKVSDKPIWEYTNAAQFRPSLRWALVVQEHQRWCANMIASGLVPCSKDEIGTLDKKSLLRQRKHGNITTMEGLVEFRDIIARKTGRSPEETDVIRYDYQIMDDINWLLTESGYKIVKRTPAASSVSASS